MSRSIDSAILATLNDAYLVPVMFTELEFDGGTLRLHTDLGDISTLSETWIGAGDLGGIDPIEERGDQSPTGTTLRLSGIDSTLLSEALTQNYYDRPVRIYFSVRDATTGALVADPFEVFAGRMDQMRVLSGIPTSVIELAVESELIEFDKSPLRYFSDSQLQKDFSGDLGFQYLAAMVNLKLTVGSKNTIRFGSHPGAITGVPTGFSPNFHF